MRGRRILLVVALAALSCGRDAARPPNERAPLRISNLSTWPIEAIYVSPHDALHWQENVLGGRILGDGESVDIRFAVRPQPTLWDLRVEGLAHYRAEWKNLDLQKISAISLRLQNGQAVADVQPSPTR